MRQAFQNTGAGEDDLSRMSVLASTHGLGAEELADAWLAYAHNNGVGGVDEGAIAGFSAHLEDRRTKQRAAARHKAVARPARAGAKRYRADTLASAGAPSAPSAGGGPASADFDINSILKRALRKTAAGTPARQVKREPGAPRTAPGAGAGASARSGSAASRSAASGSAASGGASAARSDTFFSPSSKLPPASASPYAAREHSGETSATYNAGLEAWASLPMPATDADLGRVEVEPLGRPLPRPFRFMRSSRADTADDLAEELEDFAGRAVDSLADGRENAETLQELRRDHEAALRSLGTAGAAASAADAGAETAGFEAELAAVDEAGQDRVVVVGRVRCEAASGRINAASVLIDSRGRTARVDLGGVGTYSVFPGQMVALLGVNATGRTFAAERLLRAPLLPPFSARPADAARANRGLAGRPLSVCVAAGPFTLSGSMDFTPLSDLLQTVQRRKPDVLLLMGPFVDREHDLVARGKLPRTHAQHLREVLQQVASRTRHLPTRVLVMPSTRDAGHHSCLPQPPLSAAGVALPPRMTLLPNPAVVRVNDVSIAACSEDVLFALNQSEAGARAKPAATAGGGRQQPPRLTVLAQHIVEQASFAPVFPPPDGAAVADRGAHGEAVRLPFTPDILVTPSRLKGFADRVAGDTVFVNPGRLAKAGSGGTYAALTVHPLREDQIDRLEARAEGGGDDDDAESVVMVENTRPAARTRVDVVRI